MDKRTAKYLSENDVARVWLTDDAVCVELHSGQIGREFFKGYSRLANATEKQRKEYKLSYYGIHWPSIDEDLSFQGFFNNVVSE